MASAQSPSQHVRGRIHLLTCPQAQRPDFPRTKESLPFAALDFLTLERPGPLSPSLPNSKCRLQPAILLPHSKSIRLSTQFLFPIGKVNRDAPVLFCQPREFSDENYDLDIVFLEKAGPRPPAIKVTVRRHQNVLSCCAESCNLLVRSVALTPQPSPFGWHRLPNVQHGQLHNSESLPNLIAQVGVEKIPPCKTTRPRDSCSRP
jgi:hypothetical protein